MSPKVSVCIPVYNSEVFLGQAIESVLSQSFSDFELLVVDDASSDDSAKIALSYAQNDSRIRFSRNEQNIGMVANWNHCLSLSKGEYIRYLFCDDFMLEHDALARQVDRLDSCKSLSLVSSSRVVVDATGRYVGLWKGFRELLCEEPQKVVQACLELYYLKDGRLKFGILKNLIGEPSAVMFRRELAARGFNPQYRQLVDLEMWLHLLRQGNFAYIEEPLVAFRQHEGQQTTVNLRQMVHLWEHLSLLKDNIRFAYPFMIPPFDKYPLMYECHRFVKLKNRDGFLNEEAIRNSVFRIMPEFAYALALPFFLFILPVYKLLAKSLSSALTSYREILPDNPLA